MIILMNPVMCLNFEFCIYIVWLQIPEWWMFVIVGIYIFHIFKICMTIASRRPRWISLKFGGGLHTSQMCISPNPRPTVPKPWGNIATEHYHLQAKLLKVFQKFKQNMKESAKDVRKERTQRRHFQVAKAKQKESWKSFTPMYVVQCHTVL